MFVGWRLHVGGSVQTKGRPFDAGSVFVREDLAGKESDKELSEAEDVAAWVRGLLKDCDMAIFQSH